MPRFKTTVDVADDSNPLDASLHRKFMGLRTILLGLIGVVLAVAIINWTDSVELVEWVELVLVGFMTFTFLSFLYTIFLAINDLLLHFVPDGVLKQRLFKGEFKGGITPEKLASDYASSGYILALLPIIIPSMVIGIGIILLLVIGGSAVISKAFQGALSGWSPWLILLLGICIGVASQEEDSGK
jgi:hypothetical protein